MRASILDINTKRIVTECQTYLDRYEAEGRPRFAVDIDRIIEILEENKGNNAGKRR